jgi:serine/threonine-protein kinase
MPLTAGTRLGPYEVIAAIGAGGMGEVYSARDTKLHRTVALKVLPAAFADDPDRLARFRREAQLLASLNHPNIAAIHGLEEVPSSDAGQPAVQALVMELVPGRTLEELIGPPMAVADALPIVRQIAAALEAAHEQGIVHRDLKPANIKMTDDGTVKVLDFGLAKAIAGDAAAPAPGAPGASPSFATMTSPAMTRQGVILGTAGYMAPEQAKGKPVDRRADLWAVGVVLFELLAGRPLYRGETVTETIAHVITQPPDWSALPASTPPTVRRLLRRLLEKEPRNRMQAAGDIRIEIDDYLAGIVDDPARDGAGTAPRSPAWRGWVPWAMAAGLGIALAAALWPRDSGPTRPIRLEVKVGAAERLSLDENVDGAIVVPSPDGSSLAYLATVGNVWQLFLRPLDSLESTPLAGTEQAFQHFFSPDGRSIGFFSNGSLRRTTVSGGLPTPIVPAVDPRGGTWGPDGTIVYAPSTVSGLSRVPASGGAPVELTRLAANERTHRWPSFLPDGKAVLFMCQLNDGAYDDGTIEAARLETGERTVLIRGGTFPQYVASGHLVFTRRNTLFAVRFDPVRLSVSGDPQPVLTDVLSSGAGVGAGSGNGASQIAIAANGTAVYLPGTGQGAIEVQLAVLDRTGAPLYTFPEKRGFRDPRFSPDGTRIATRISDGQTEQIYILDLTRETLTKLTFDSTFAGMPVWSRDGRQLAYTAARDNQGVLTIHLTPSDGSGVATQIAPAEVARLPSSFSPDGRLLAAFEINPKTSMDVIVISMADGEVTPFVNTPAIELAPTFSPDGRWVAYQSIELAGAMDVFVRAWPDGTGRRQVSSGGGFLPHWTRDGQELIYGVDTADGASLMAVAVTANGGTLTLGRPQKLFDAPLAKPPSALWFDVSADGSRFAALLADEDSTVEARTSFVVIFNVFEEIRRVLDEASR